MKKFVAVLVVAGLVLSLTSPCRADGPVKKLGRGIANVATSPMGFLKGIEDARDEKGVFAALTWGILQGTVNAVNRVVVGAYEIVTFPIPLPAGYKPILTDPEFFAQETEE